MDVREFYPIIEPVDASLAPFLLDQSKDESKKSDANRHRDRINTLMADYSEELKKQTESTKEDYKKRIQREADAINRIISS